MIIIHVSRDATGWIVKAPGGFKVSVYHHPTNQVLSGFKRSAKGALDSIYRSRRLWDEPEGRA